MSNLAGSMLALIALAAVIGGVLFWQKPAQEVVTPPTATSTAATTTPATKTYAHAIYSYSFVYPSDWVLEPEGKVMTPASKIPSIVSVHETKEDQPKRFSVTINENKRDLTQHAEKTEAVMIGGVSVTAYLFPHGYECEEEGDCSFFLIPIERNGVTYEITGANEATTLTAYRAMLESFRFTN